MRIKLLFLCFAELPEPGPVTFLQQEDFPKYEDEYFYFNFSWKNPSCMCLLLNFSKCTTKSEAKGNILPPISWQKQTFNFASDWDSDDLSKFYVHRSNYRCPHFDGLKPDQQLFYEYVSGIQQI